MKLMGKEKLFEILKIKVPELLDYDDEKKALFLKEVEKEKKYLDYFEKDGDDSEYIELQEDFSGSMVQLSHFYSSSKYSILIDFDGCQEDYIHEFFVFEDETPPVKEERKEAGN